MFKKIHQYIAGIFFIALLFTSCKKWDDYKKYTSSGEKVYPGGASNVSALPGNGRVLLTWVQGIDTKVKKYAIFWANGVDSAVFDASKLQPGDTVKYYIDKLEET